MRYLGVLVRRFSQLLRDATGRAAGWRPGAGCCCWWRHEFTVLGTCVTVTAVVAGAVDGLAVPEAVVSRAVHVGGAAGVGFVAIELGSAHVHGHHPPGQILHALCIGQLRLCARVQLPDLGAERVVLLHLLGRLHAGAGGIIAKRWKDGVVQHAVAGSVLAGGKVHGALGHGKVHGRAEAASEWPSGGEGGLVEKCLWLGHGDDVAGAGFGACC